MKGEDESGLLPSNIAGKEGEGEDIV